MRVAVAWVLVVVIWALPVTRILSTKPEFAAKSPAKPRSRPGFAPKYGCIMSSGVVLYSQETGPTSRFRHKRPGPESRIGGHSGQVAVHQVRAGGSGMGVGDGFRGETFTGAGSPKGGSVTGTVSAYAFFYPLSSSTPAPGAVFWRHPAVPFAIARNHAILLETPIGPHRCHECLPTAVLCVKC